MMFNVGIVASGRSGPIYSLGSHPMTLIQGQDSEGFPTYGYTGNVYVNGYTVYNAVPSFPLTPWVTPVQASGSHQARATLEAGSSDSWSGSLLNTWHTIHILSALKVNWYGYSVPTGGRIRIDIRNTATQQIVATAQWWTPGYAP